MRLFVGLPVPDDVRRAVDRAVAGTRERYEDLRWTRPDGWHVTLAFLGEVAATADRPDPVAAVTDVLTPVTVNVTEPPRHAELGRPGRFGRTTAYYRVDDRPSGSIAALGAAVQAAVAGAAVPVDRREVHPHVTLARARRGQRLPSHLLDDLPAVDHAWATDRLVLYRSHLGAGGSRYEALTELPLR